MRRYRGPCALALVCLLCASCAAPGGTAGEESPAESAARPSGPPPGPFDYQLGGAYPPAADAVTVVRDATEHPEPGLYSVCYVNGFQTQPQDASFWLEEHPDLVLRGADGEPVADPDWPDEYLLDTSTAERRGRIADLVADTVGTCAERGFDAVEFDNLDSFTRGAVTAVDNLALAADLVAAAHALGLAAAQKNTAELAARARREAGFDFAVAEECVAFDECAAYTSVYGDAVLVVEYPDTLGTGLARVCDDPDTPPSTVLRDRGLLVPGRDGHLRESC
ncbi:MULTISPECIES: endo alpha-1,4 polygalactosaminidase [unclassified Nocardiopsis]|uniref:endo alpha-1,4 polygalactosaminidase n=1 Tax=unclassified Nocardiopsis TaxID=2649073 RepID=UPI0019154F31|nr:MULTISPECIES: endo alpha-1,4 polygalactosaminidase [unclassified Nocardiopsis]